MKLKDIADILNKDRHISELSLEELREIRSKVNIEIEKKDSQKNRDLTIDKYTKLLKNGNLMPCQISRLCDELKYKLEEL